MMPLKTSESLDGQWLEAFKASRSEEAFRALVDKYLSMVFGLALRRTGQRVLAEEATQNVFAALAKRAQRLTANPTLAGWLYRCAMIETSEILRREGAHQRKVKAFTEYSGAWHDGDNNIWHEAWPILDEAINELPPRDRDLVLQRFFEGKSFREIGLALGKSEDAAQKQCERILRRLAQNLSSKGIVISTVTLAAGLSSGLNAGVPAGLGLALSKATLAGISTLDARTLIFKTIQLMAHTKTKTAVAVALAAAIPLSWQWKENRALQSELAQIKKQLAEARLTAESAPARPAVRRSAPFFRPNLGLASIHPAQGPKEDHLESNHGAAAWEQALLEPDPVHRTVRISALLDALIPESAHEVAELFERLQQTGRRFDAEHHLFLRSWGKLDGATALARVYSSTKQPGNSAQVMAALAGWASVSPHLAQSWVEGLPDSSHKERLIYGLLDGWSMVDFAAAAAFAESRPRSPARDEFRRLLLERSLDAGGIAAAQDWFGRIPNDSNNELYKQRAFDEVVRAMLYRDPSAAAAWISQQTDERFLKGGAVRETAGKLAKTAPTEAMRWLESLQGVNDKAKQDSLATVVSAWTDQDAAGAGSYLRQNANHPHYDSMARSFANALADTDPHLAISWAQSVRDEAQRDRSVLSVARQWVRTEGESALAKLRNAGLSEEIIAQAQAEERLMLRTGKTYQRLDATVHGGAEFSGPRTITFGAVGDGAYASLAEDGLELLAVESRWEAAAQAQQQVAELKLIEAKQTAVRVEDERKVTETAATQARAGVAGGDVSFLEGYLKYHGTSGANLNCAQCHQ